MVEAKLIVVLALSYFAHPVTSPGCSATVADIPPPAGLGECEGGAEGGVARGGLEELGDKHSDEYDRDSGAEGLQDKYRIPAETVIEITNFKFQVPNKFQIPITKIINTF